MKLIPRVRGSAIRQGKHWTWEIEVLIGSDDPVFLFNKEGRFLNRESAINDLRLHCVKVMGLVAEAIGADQPTELMDLNQGIVQSLSEFAKPTKYVPEGEGDRG